MRAALLFLLGLGTAQAAGVMTIEGSLTSNTEKECAIESRTQIFYIEKAKLTPPQLEALKTGQKKVSLTVPFSSIERVQEKNPKPAPPHS